jgi:hypothetical protein
MGGKKNEFTKSEDLNALKVIVGLNAWVLGMHLGWVAYCCYTLLCLGYFLSCESMETRKLKYKEH